MELLVVRHAEAEERAAAAAAGRGDSLRRLTPRGRRRMQSAVRGLRVLGLRCELVLHGPWTRAAQTAELLAPLADGGLRAWSALARAPDARLLAELARLDAKRRGSGRGTREAGAGGRGGTPQAATQCLALVGHQPWLGELVAWLTVGERDAGSALRIGKGSVAWLSGAPSAGGMELVALLPARTLRRLGRAAR